MSAVVFSDQKRKLHSAGGALLHLAVVLPKSVPVDLFKFVALLEKLFLLPRKFTNIYFKRKRS